MLLKLATNKLKSPTFFVILEKKRKKNNNKKKKKKKKKKHTKKKQNIREKNKVIGDFLGMTNTRTHRAVGDHEEGKIFVVAHRVVILVRAFVLHVVDRMKTARIVPLQVCVCELQSFLFASSSYLLLLSLYAVDAP